MGKGLKTNRLLTPACFTVILTLHIAVLSGFDGFTQKKKPLTKVREVSLTLDVADQTIKEGEAREHILPEATQELPLPAAPLPQEERILPEPVSEATPLVQEESSIASPAEPEIPLPAAASLSEPERALPEAESLSAGALSSAGASSSAADEGPSVHTGNGIASDIPGSVSAPKPRMTDTEYLALILGRLEKNKIYPLSARKRGIEGDIKVHFTIRQDGTVSEIGLADPSGHRFLAQAAFETIRSASPFPIREGREGDYTAQVNIRYRLEDQAAQKK
ncbi:MAG: energy transducer TonB [Treponema sp.]|nr:energy transducer TonB [Treponema sp.]